MPNIIAALLDFATTSITSQSKDHKMPDILVRSLAGLAGALVVVVSYVLAYTLLAIYYHQKDLTAARDAARSQLERRIALGEKIDDLIRRETSELEALDLLAELPFSYGDKRMSDDYLTIRQRARDDVRTSIAMREDLLRNLAAGEMQATLDYLERKRKWWWAWAVEDYWYALNEALIYLVHKGAGIEYENGLFN